MSTVIMMCGVSGSGKTTYAKQKEKEGFIRLSIDEEMWNKYGQRGVDYPYSEYDELSEKVELSLQNRLLELISKNKNIVLDFSFWNRDDRNFYKKIITESGAKVKLIYLKANKDLLKKRLAKRNLNLNANSPFIISDKILNDYFDGFQEPIDEGETVIIQNEF
ncbi:AAA family ATPase [Peptacetobacter sp.]|uniref:AAA family ATPase n=1 Tax=Peptacetobacter sp. TaxID=2991975 RepID=UPI0026290BBF|nr:ATP-binding protein [Peptacetobacter sp.]